MGTCEMGGYRGHKPSPIIAAGERHVFGSFEYATPRTAPVREHCGSRVMVHGLEADRRFFCWATWAGQGAATDDARDRIGTSAAP